jgi:hypothetical protein
MMNDERKDGRVEGKAMSDDLRRRDGEKLTKLAGLITYKEAEELTKIINAGCGQIDNEWYC